MDFRAYPKIHRYGKEEVDGILASAVTVQEKIDGANISIWLDKDGIVRCGSRTRELPLDESFNGFQEYVRENTEIEKWLRENPDHRLYGEWLVKHTITYPDDAYRKIYLFDIFDQTTEHYYSQRSVKEVAERLGLQFPYIFAENELLSLDQIKEFVGKSQVGANGEGVVIKNLDYRNRFGDQVYAKVVHEKFKEANAIVFGGNNKGSEKYEEMYLVNKYCTLGRVQKIMMKLQTVTEKRLDMEHTSQIAGTCYHDLITEEAWEIAKRKKEINFKWLQSLATRKFIQLYHDILNNSISIADSGKEQDV